jgi:hypothetical protein
MKRFLALWLPVIAWMIVIFIGSSIGNVPRVGGKTTDGLVHRAAHVLEFAVLGALLLRAVSNDKPITKREIIITLILATFYGVSDEVHQRFTPGRSSEGLSVLFDVAGSAGGVWWYRWWSRRGPARQLEQTTARQVDPSRERPLDH